MKSAITAAIGVLLTLFSPRTLPAEIAVVDTSALFPQAEAWEITIHETHKLPEFTSRPSLSHDFKRLAYITATPTPLPDAPQFRRASEMRLEVISLADWKIVKLIRLPMVEMLDGSRSVAWSPDDTRIAFVSDAQGSPLVVVELESSKIITVPFSEQLSSNARIVWPSQSTVILIGFGNFPSRTLDLDSLKMGWFSPEKGNQIDFIGSEVQQSTHEKAYLRLEENHHYVDAYSLIVLSRRQPYGRALLQDIAGGRDMYTWALWTPDLRYVVLRTRSDQPATVLQLGRRETPALTYGIRGANFSSAQLKAIQKAIADGKRVWLNVFEKRINPLNGKLVGADEDKLRGTGFLRQLTPSLRFQYSFELQPCTLGDVVSHVHIDGSDQFSSDLWGEVVSEDEAQKIELQPVVPPHVEGTPNTLPSRRTLDDKLRLIKASPAWSVIRLAIEAAGGLDQVLSGEATRTQLHGKALLPDYGLVQTETTVFYKSPDKLRQEATYRVKRETINVTLTFSAGNAGGCQFGKHFQLRDSSKESLTRSVLDAEWLRGVLAGDYIVKLNPDVLVDGKLLRSITVRFGSGYSPTLLLDPELGVLLRKRVTDTSGATIAETVYSDYTTVGGSRIAGQVQAFSGGRLEYEGRLVSFSNLKGSREKWFDDACSSVQE